MPVMNPHAIGRSKPSSSTPLETCAGSGGGFGDEAGERARCSGWESGRESGREGVDGFVRGER